MNIIDKEFVKQYIGNEIIYLKQDIEGERKYNLNNYNVEGLEEDLTFLTKLSEEEIEDITQKVNDDEELTNKINELIHYWLYHK